MRGDWKTIIQKGLLLLAFIWGISVASPVEAYSSITGNHAESKAVSFLITPNIFVQWYTNKPIFIGSILVMAGAVGFIFFRRKLTVPPSTTA